MYVALLGLCIWGVVGPTIFIRTRLRHKKMARALRNAGIELTNPAVKSILELGTDVIEPFIRYIDDVTATGSAESAGTDENISGRIIHSLMRGHILSRNADGSLKLNEEPGPPELMLLRERMNVMWGGDEAMVKYGILSQNEDGLKVNQTALHALTVLAKECGKTAPITTTSEEVGWPDAGHPLPGTPESP